MEQPAPTWQSHPSKIRALLQLAGVPTRAVGEMASMAGQWTYLASDSVWDPPRSKQLPSGGEVAPAGYVTVKRRTLHAHSFIGSRLFQSKPSLPATPPAMSSTLHWKRPNSKKLAAIRFNDTHITVCRPTPTPSPAAVFFFSFQNPAAIHHRRSNLLA